ncbi:MAG: hypothetical protein D6786_02625 [Gammaproteobacteria bacterium]|nr:MAG: hypothetical protein D6786_02625 [Gammaproteobacteria bacterium]
MSRGQALPPGSELNEYRIDEQLGKGAFAHTYRAWDRHLETPVAIKEFFLADYVVRQGDRVALRFPEHAEFYQWALERFLREARILARFRHPNIVRVRRYFTANRTAYIVMDHEEGRSLDQVLEEGAVQIDESWLRGLLIPLLEGLREVHEKRYLHRDIKPGNIFIREDGSPLLLDFGAARLEIGATSHDQTTIFTPGYAPVEQYDSQSPQAPCSDLYALGATLYRCINGKRPQEATRRLQRVRAGQTDPMTPATGLTASGCSRGFLEVIDWMLAIEPRERPQTVDALLERLEREAPAAGDRGAVFLYRPRRAVRQHKIVITGPVGAGKSTAIRTLSDIPVVETDQQASDMTAERKQTTTVAMDYGMMTLSQNERLHLYGTPGQERFDFMWEILQEGGIGLVLLIDNTRRDPFQDLDFFLRAFRDFIRRTKVVIGVTRMDLSPDPPLEAYHRHLATERNEWRIKAPVMEVDARSYQDMSMLVRSLLCTIDPGVEDFNV